MSISLSNHKVSPDDFSHHLFPSPEDLEEGKGKKILSLLSLESCTFKKKILPTTDPESSRFTEIPLSRKFTIMASKTESMLNHVRSKREVENDDNIVNNNFTRNGDLPKQKSITELNVKEKIQLNQSRSYAFNFFSFSNDSEYYDGFLRFSSKKFELEKIEHEFRVFRASDVNVTLGACILLWTGINFLLRGSVTTLWDLDKMNFAFLINFLLTILALFSCAFVCFNRLAIVSNSRSILHSYVESSTIRMNSYGQYVEDSIVYFSAAIPSLKLLSRVLMGPCNLEMSSWEFQVIQILY